MGLLEEFGSEDLKGAFEALRWHLEAHDPSQAAAHAAAGHNVEARAGKRARLFEVVTAPRQGRPGR